MALSKAKKSEVVAEVSDLLASSKLTVIAKYKGTSVKSMRLLRQMAEDNATTVKVFKNRLVAQALKSSPQFKDFDSEMLKDMLIYAFSSEDETLPAQTLANFAKTNPTIEFIGALSSDGSFMTATDVTSLADLPPKEQLRSMLVGTIGAPLSSFVAVLSGNLRGLVSVLNAREKQLSN